MQKPLWWLKEPETPFSAVQVEFLADDSQFPRSTVGIQ